MLRAFFSFAAAAIASGAVLLAFACTNPDLPPELVDQPCNIPCGINEGRTLPSPGPTNSPGVGGGTGGGGDASVGGADALELADTFVTEEAFSSFDGFPPPTIGPGPGGVPPIP